MPVTVLAPIYSDPMAPGDLLMPYMIHISHQRRIGQTTVDLDDASTDALSYWRNVDADKRPNS
jgi:hypothetical protein